MTIETEKMDLITVFENPWPARKDHIFLEIATIRHLELMEIFLRLMPYMRKNEENEIHVETLVYMEWRYVNYLRFLSIHGVAPNDCPPPWDVAIIWYCHLLSPYSFHRHLWDSNHLSFGLNHHQFPLQKLLSLYKSGKWSDRKAQKKWDDWNRQEKNRSPNLPFQLWPFAPWETPPQKSNLLSRIFRKSSSDQREEKEVEEELQVHFFGTLCRPNGPMSIGLPGYTRWRTRENPIHCVYRARHSQRGDRCQLRPWSKVQQLQQVLSRQYIFWKTVISARDSNPNYASKSALQKDLIDYERFIKLLGQPPPLKKTPQSGVWRVDMDAIPAQRDVKLGVRNREFVPPNLTIDLIWHTHRLYPASYWVWSFNTAGGLIDYMPSRSALTVKQILNETQKEWKRQNESGYDEQYSLHESDLDGYFPDAAVVPVEHPARAKARYILGGMNPVKEWKRRTRGQYCVFEGVYVSFDGGGFDSGSGGGDGGCGGDGGGGGGGGGDGGS